MGIKVNYLIRLPLHMSAVSRKTLGVAAATNSTAPATSLHVTSNAIQHFAVEIPCHLLFFDRLFPRCAYEFAHVFVVLRDDLDTLALSLKLYVRHIWNIVDLKTLSGERP